MSPVPAGSAHPVAPNPVESAQPSRQTRPSRRIRRARPGRVGASARPLRTTVDSQTHLHLVDLRTGATRPLGKVGEGAPLVGMAIEP